ncbi:hypothetical protein GCM10011351_10860 [Paraliobacillus quinghaiensis]|uniref:Uncharacterized protein n=1 Tax=Paraliobacillus quinghaiensis TaxID=470815 RepID=A0A917TLF4_9BACI|nr:hypothetical protein [Paraliobacillus quinghaiensis]GGM26935.1 hypothetical protein GCM10011351_10860 [Paraliobacillus quinghaiensis]
MKIKQDNNKRFIPKQKDRERIRVKNDLTDDLFDVDEELHGDSVNEHKNIESGNAFIAEKEIQQTFHNS